jgi:hypothetical protein
MNLSKFSCLFFVFITVFVSCNRETKAIFPEKIQDEISQYIQTHRYTAVIYVASNRCTSGGRTSGGNTSGGATGDNISSCWKEKGSVNSGKHFTQCKNATTSTNILKCKGLVKDHDPIDSSGQCHPNSVN